jgi:hypothetical protein
MTDSAPLYKVFISYSSADSWVAKQLKRNVEESGAATFLYETDVEYGQEFEKEMRVAAQTSKELLVLLTSSSVSRPYIWTEIGSFWYQDKLIVIALYGLTANELTSQEGTPAFVKGINLVDINKIEGYFQQLKGRVEKLRQDNG